MKLIELVRGPAPRGWTEAGVVVRPRHHQRLRRSRVAGAVALGLPLDDARRHRRARPSTPSSRPTSHVLIERAHRHPQAGRLPDRRGLAAGRALLRGRARHRAAQLHRRAAGRRPHRPLAGRTHARACSTCAPATAAWPCWPRWPGPTCRSTRRHLGRRAGSGAHQRGPPRACPTASGWCGSDGLAALPGPYDLILCNPPYVNARSDGRAARRIPRRARTGAGRRRRRHGLRPRAAARRARAHMTDRRPCWCWRSATSARISKPPSRASKRSGWTSAGDDQVLLLEPARERLLREARIHDHPSETSTCCAAAPRCCCDSVSVTLNPGEKVGLVGRNGAGKSTPVRAAQRQPARRHRRLLHARRNGAWARSRRTCPRPTSRPPTSCCGGDTRLMELRRPSSPRPRPAGDGMAIAHAHSDLADAGEHDAVPRAQALILGLGFQRRRSSTRRSTASPAAGACGCNWRAR